MGLWDSFEITGMTSLAEYIRAGEENTMDLIEQFPNEYQAWVEAGGISNNFRKHLIGIAAISPTPEALRFLVDELQAGVNQLRGALAQYPFP